MASIITKMACLLSQAGMSEVRARLLRDRQKTVAYEAIGVGALKGGEQRAPDEVLGTGADDAASQDPDAAVSEREQAL